MKKLPVGLQSITDIITQDFTYVDKTGMLYEIIKQKGYYFLSRPRRFGKTLTCSTLEAIFQGKKDLFKGLEISKTDYNWTPYSVVRLDFNSIAHQTIDELKISLANKFKDLAQSYNLDSLSSSLVQDNFNELIIKLAKKNGPVVVLIDEYDKPILDHIYNKEMALEMRSFMKSFYGVLKGESVDANLRFLFLTGVSKFSKVSIFSELNNLDDLTTDRRAAELCGYTQKELETVFDEHIQNLAQNDNCTKSDMLAKLKYWYNGFQFSELNCKVYNPFSILNCLNKKKFTNYWFASDTPTFLIKFIQQNPDLVKKLIMLETEELAAIEFDTLSIESYFENMILVFLQAGYLTISGYNPKSDNYSLSYPNNEIRRSMTECILNLITHNMSIPKFGRMVERFRDALSNDDIEAFCQTMKDFFYTYSIYSYNQPRKILSRSVFYHY